MRRGGRRWLAVLAGVSLPTLGLGGYLAWFVHMAVTAERAEAREVAARFLGCAPAEVELGGSHQENEGPDVYAARFRGKTVEVECLDTVTTFPECYVRVAYACRVIGQ